MAKILSILLPISLSVLNDESYDTTMYFEYWAVLGVLISIFMSVIDMPLRIGRLLFLSFLGSIGAVLGGVLAYFIYGTQIAGVDIALLLVPLTGAIGFLFLREPIGKLLNVLRGGESHARWSI
jgi:hypothetical protein